jgi:hypothetical protein
LGGHAKERQMKLMLVVVESNDVYDMVGLSCNGVPGVLSLWLHRRTYNGVEVDAGALLEELAAAGCRFVARCPIHPQSSFNLVDVEMKVKHSQSANKGSGRDGTRSTKRK